MMGWIIGKKRKDNSAEIAEIEHKFEQNVETVRGKRLALETILTQMAQEKKIAGSNP